MDTKEFNELVLKLYDDAYKLLKAKGIGYTGDYEDRLHHFKRCAAMDGETQEQALKGMWKKQLVSIFDAINDPDNCDLSITKERILDSINYHSILLMMLIERHRQEGPKPAPYKENTK